MPVDSFSVVSLVVDALGAVGFAWLVIVVHEAGHLLVARVAGVAPQDVRLVLNSWPAHVQLRSGSTWRSPDDPDYAPTFLAHRNSVGWAAAFVSGGFLLEIPVSLVAIAVLSQYSAGAAVVLAWTTAVLAALYLGADLVLSSRSPVSYGDHVALWRLQPVAGVGIVLALLGTKVAGIAIAT